VVLSVLMLILAVPGLRTVAHRIEHASPGWIACWISRPVPRLRRRPPLTYRPR
jgi:hypothetical protein